MTATSWQRVTRRRPCPVCGKPDWCTIGSDGRTACCARVPSDRRLGEAGWAHRLGAGCRPPAPPPGPEPARLSAAELEELQRLHLVDGAGRLEGLARELGVTIRSLERLGVGWSTRHRAWAFPMTDHRGRLRGFRLRLATGRKLAVRGGREGLFVPEGLPAQLERLVVLEGASDCAAGLDLGLACIGRPSCSGAVALTTFLVRDRRPEQVVVVADADAPGRRGAEALAGVLALYCAELRVVEPPAPFKDIRDWKRAGATLAAFEELVAAAPAWRVRVARTA